MAGGTSTTTRTEPWSEQKPYLEEGFKAAQSLYNRGSPAYYGGPTLAGIDPSQQVAQRATLGYALGPRPQAMQGAAETALVRGLSGAVNTQVLDPMVRSYQNQMMRQLQGDTLPALRESIVNYQPGGSTRANMIQSNAIAAAQEAMQNKVAELYGGAFDTAQQRVPQFQQLYPSIMGAPLGLFSSVGDVGAQRRALSQEAINRDMSRYAYEANAPQMALQNYMAGISGDYGGVTTQTPSPISTLGSIAGIIGSLM